jgi:hypothetical protein
MILIKSTTEKKKKNMKVCKVLKKKKKKEKDNRYLTRYKYNRDREYVRNR